MSKPVRVVVVAINGYGRGYLRLMLDQAAGHDAVLAGVVDPAAEQSPDIGEVRAAGIPVHADIGDFYAKDSADLAVFSTPIQWHCPNVILALGTGSNVLCEKPLCATLDEGLRMLAAARERPGQFVAIGYNWSFSDTIGRIKGDIRAGVYGAPKALKCLVSWPRSQAYYARNDWAGMLKTRRGEWVLDSPLNNATAHFLHNMFYLCGDQPHLSAEVVDVQAELFRLNPIASFDTAAVRCHLRNGAVVHFYTTHADENCCGPLFRYEFEEGVLYGAGDTAFVGVRRNGERRVYALDPEMNGYANKLWQCVGHCRHGGVPACGIEAALEQTRVVNGAHLSMPGIVDFPAGAVARKALAGGDVQWHFPGLLATLVQCYDQQLLPSEHGAIPYARAGGTIDLRQLRHFALPGAGA